MAPLRHHQGTFGFLCCKLLAVISSDLDQDILASGTRFYFWSFVISLDRWSLIHYGFDHFAESRSMLEYFLLCYSCQAVH